jgi:hypothetical protein
VGGVRHYTSDFEPICKEPFRYDFEDDLTSVFKVKGIKELFPLSFHFEVDYFYDLKPNIRSA